MKSVARMIRRHRELILNWFRAKGEISNGVVEGLNNKAKLTMRKSYGFRSPEILENPSQLRQSGLKVLRYGSSKHRRRPNQNEMLLVRKR